MDYAMPLHHALLGVPTLTLTLPHLTMQVKVTQEALVLENEDLNLLLGGCDIVTSLCIREDNVSLIYSE